MTPELLLLRGGITPSSALQASANLFSSCVEQAARLEKVMSWARSPDTTAEALKEISPPHNHIGCTRMSSAAMLCVCICVNVYGDK